MTFQDKWTRWHHKPIGGTRYSSNNGWIYSAECASMGLPVDRNKLEECFNASITEYGFKRHPDQDSVPISHDEIIGAAALLGTFGSIFALQVFKWERNNWQICDLPNFTPIPYYKINWLKVILSFYKVYKLDVLYKKTQGKEGRNSRHSVIDYPELYPIAFKLGAWKRYLVKKHTGITPTGYETAMWFFSKLYTIYFSKNNSSLRLLGFQLKMLQHKNLIDKALVYLYNRKHNVLKYLQEYNGLHPIRWDK